MPTSQDYIEFVCEQIYGVGEVRSRKMFGEYMVYVNDKPIFLVCDNTVYIKMLDCVTEMLHDAPTGHPYEGAKLYYILDIEDGNLASLVATALEKVVPIPTPKKKKPTKA